MQDYHAERFVERGTDYNMEHGVLSIYETNCPCKGVEFKFDKYMLTLMLSGHKSIMFNDARFEFFPGTLYIPAKNTVQRIDIPNASLFNPTKCLVLEISPKFMEHFLQEIIETENSGWLTHELSRNVELDFFLSNDEGIIECFKRLYQLQLGVKSRADELIVEMGLKELLLRVLKTEGGNYLLDIAHNEVDDAIQKSILYIRANLSNQLTIDKLAHISGLGKTNYFNKFKEATGLTPINYIIKERIEYAKTIMNMGDSLQAIAFKSGFNSYEHFCKSFKKLTNNTPLKYKKMKAQRQSILEVRV